ncbi:restriction endonuclease subunit S [Niabella sp. W65]|nr:restriction endonuclease subunit S [Niabella sp. W65]MCH7365204.1 restriction endonuclease subunit S [Niabella sp. W65]
MTPLRNFSRFYDGNIRWLKSADVKNDFITTSEEFISELALEKTSAKVYPIDSILIAMYGQGKTKGSVGILKIEASCNQACGVIYPNDFVKPIVLFSQLLYSYDYIRSLGRGANRDNLSLNILKKIKILIPDDEVQNRYEKIFTVTKDVEHQLKNIFFCFKISSIHTC